MITFRYKSNGKKRLEEIRARTTNSMLKDEGYQYNNTPITVISQSLYVEEPYVSYIVAGYHNKNCLDQVQLLTIYGKEQLISMQYKF